MDFEIIWDRIEKCAGETFSTVRGINFTYRIAGDTVVPEHTGFPISKNQFLKAYQMGPLNNPGQINRTVMGPAYVFAILTDARIR